MFKNYLKTAFRYFWKNKTASAINVFGLAIGLTSCVLITLYIRHELSYDKFQKNGDRIVRVIMEYKFDGSPESNKGNWTSVRVAPVLKRNFPEVESTIRMFEVERVVSYQDENLIEKNFLFADSTFFNIFSFKLLQGNPRKVLDAPDQLVLTQSTAKKYFGNDNPIGKILHVGNDTMLFKIAGVVEDCPSNSQIKFDFIAPFSYKLLGINKDNENSYWNANYTTYLLLKDNASVASLQAKLPAFMKQEMMGEGAKVNFYLEPFLDIHLHSPFPGFEPNNSIDNLFILGAITLLILFIACFTYINLSTATSMERAKEVGVRKTIGAGKRQLFWQFLGESAILCFIAMIISIVIAVILLPVFNHLVDKQLQSGTIFSFPFILLLLLIVVIISVAAGIYPALILTEFQPVKMLKGAFKNTSSGRWLRKSLIVFQFIISVFLIVSTLIVQKQLYYIQHKDLGYNKEHIVVLPMTNVLRKNKALIKQELKENPNVISVSASHNLPVNIIGGYNMRTAEMPENEQINVKATEIDEDYIKTTGMQIIAGEDLTEQDVKDATIEDSSKKNFHFILNEAAVKELGWTVKNAVGKKMFLGNNRPGFVRGVVKSFHFESMHNTIKSVVLFPNEWSTNLLVKITGKNLPTTISFLKEKWTNIEHTRPFEYHFMDQDYDKLYSSEIRLGEVTNIFASIAIILACLGLLGLSSYTAQQRIKEIGIRKILGASIKDIVLILSVDFIKLACIAIAIAIPIVWWVMAKWLQGFAYRVQIGWSIFFIAVFIIILLVVITVSYHAVKTALANPVKTLRTE